jgi:hypothetical protein
MPSAAFAPAFRNAVPAALVTLVVFAACDVPTEGSRSAFDPSRFSTVPPLIPHGESRRDCGYQAAWAYDAHHDTIPIVTFSHHQCGNVYFSMIPRTFLSPT